MAMSIEHRESASEPPELIARLARATEPRDVERLADELAAARDLGATCPLLRRLSDAAVQADADASSAVCRALVAFDVMCRRNGAFYFLPRRMLSDDVVKTIRELGPAIPWAYFDTLHV